jgi:hypothetical protein
LAAVTEQLLALVAVVDYRETGVTQKIDSQKDSYTLLAAETHFPIPLLTDALKPVVYSLTVELVSCFRAGRVLDKAISC